TGKPPAKPDTSRSTPMRMALHSLLLDRVRLLYKDTLTRNTAMANIGHSQTTMQDTLDLAGLRFELNRFVLQNTTASYRNSVAGLSTSIGLAGLHTDDLILDLNKLIIHSRALQLDSANFAMDNAKQPR